MDRLLGRELDAIARDRRAGAAELALKAATALRAWLRRHRKPTEAELLEIARTLVGAQPSMAPLLRLANEVALAADAEGMTRSTAGEFARFAELIERGPAEISAHFLATLQSEPPRVLATYSYSSTVVRAFVAARGRIQGVYCSEGRPGLEGQRTAKELARAGIAVSLLTDAALPRLIEEAGALAVGADAIESRGFINKVGTKMLADRMAEVGRPVWVLADTSKLLPEPLASELFRFREGPEKEIWERPPRGVSVRNPYFERTSLPTAARVLTERGWMTPAEIQRELGRIPVSPRLRRELAAEGKRAD